MKKKKNDGELYKKKKKKKQTEREREIFNKRKNILKLIYNNYHNI